MESIVTLGKRREGSSLPAEVQSQNECGAVGKDEEGQGPLREGSEPAEPQPNINKKSKKQLVSTRDSHL